MAIKSKYELRKFGPITERRDYSISQHKFETPDFLEMQRESVEKFLKEGIEEELRNIYPIEANGKVRIDYIHNSAHFEYPKKIEYECIKEAKQKGSSYQGKLKAKLRQTNTITGEVEDSEVVFAEIPIMTYGGSFIINGSEKVIVSQLIRSTGAYFGVNVRNKQANDLFNKVEIIPQLGSWVEIYHKVTSSGTDTIKIHIDKNKSFLLSTFLKALGFNEDGIRMMFGNVPELEETLKKDKISKFENADSTLEAQEAIYRLIRKGDRMTADSARNLIPSTLFNEKRYNLTETGRFTLNRKLNVKERIANSYLAENLYSEDGELLHEKNTFITWEIARKIHKEFEDGIIPMWHLPNIDENVYGSQVEPQENEPEEIQVLRNRLYVPSVWIYPTEKDMLNDQKIQVLGNDPTANEKFLLVPDIVATISYYFNLLSKVGIDDDPDSLINKRIVTIGELLQNQFRIGLIKLEKNTRERISTKDIDKITPKNVTNNKPIFNQFKSFFNTSKLSQFMDQCNPLAEISNKRRITSLGPRGLNRDTAQFEVRDVHPTHFGRICPIETPEGPNIGLILNLASFSKIDKYGFIQSPYFKVTNRKVDFSEPIYLTAIEEVGYTFAQSTTHIKNNVIVDEKVMARRDNEFVEVSADEVDYIGVSNRQMTSIAASAIPFLENDDANRALMGSNMQRQAVPVLFPEKPLVATGVEADIAKYSSTNICATRAGVVSYVDAEIIKIIPDGLSKPDVYHLRTFERSNQGTLIHQIPIVKLNQRIEAGDLLVDGPSMQDGELALGKNVLVGFTTWHGYNYEDAVVLSERLVKDDVYTSIHIEEQTIQFRHSKAGDDLLTADDIPNVSNFSKRFLDENGIVKVGSEVSAGDILVGRTSPKGEENPTPEEKLMAAIFGQKTTSRKDTSLKVKHGHNGTVVAVDILSRETGDQLEDGIDKIVKVSIAQKRKIKVGDKMAGRHGNKGVVSIVLPVEEMPYLEDGTPLDIVLNPQGVPSRMNIGQVLELHLGLAAKKLNTKFVTPIFDGITHNQIREILEEAKIDPSGKMVVYDGRTGEPFDNPISVGIMYYLKLYHMVDDKMHARSVGPYSLITQQPLGGKSQNGGQRFGEMETWAIESYGASNVLQELLTYKSDNILGRNQLYNSLARNVKLPKPGMPESFNVLAYELRGLGIKLEAHEKLNENEVDDDIQRIDTKYYQEFEGGAE
ncbi:DNA-directed RNA polymerase subunit beta [Metamycoplasma equirhinis]|uniref:DNA-directed RNA polymerase subunit beta n=2 Tax=Metamycoplasma equirhinis TaxID=92402 RepID=A0ABZ0PB14_9BACT|nr:DNA-directed RNA polymerase subunit beta [Metamycoplasma equirhinis]TPD98196.1 DNA-directed RNA polymerase subunit beta [Metamycoplasma equirhinis]WPB54212.1 DNA-directed RNA polymerase subunit beta [Metamycoplasma equirhinis]